LLLVHAGNRDLPGECLTRLGAAAK
jgi:hypothetical protein